MDKTMVLYDDVIKWKHFLRYWPFEWGIHRSPVNSPHKIQWRGALMFSLICAWTSGWVNNREAGDWRRHRPHYDINVKSWNMKRSMTLPDQCSGIRLPVVSVNYRHTGCLVDHYNDVIMGAIASQITSLTIVYSTVYSGTDESKHQSSASLAFVRGIHRGHGEFPAQMASNAENVSIWWRHHAATVKVSGEKTCL